MVKYSKIPLLLFDGHCNLCNGAVQWVLKRDKKGQVYFASLQSETGEKALKDFQLDDKELDSMVFISNGKAYTKSSAALKLATTLGGVYTMAGWLMIVPAFLRNAIYDFVARNRYRWFGRSETCWLPRPEWKERFLS